LATTDTLLSQLIINKMPRATYDELKANGQINDNELYFITDTSDETQPQRITLVASAGQTAFTIPFNYDSNSSNLTVYFNGLLMKETDNYTVDTTTNTVNLVDFAAEEGDIITIMGILGALSIDFDQEAIEAINSINQATANAETTINNKVSAANAAIDEKIEEVNNIINELPSDVTTLMSKNATNTMTSTGKITMASSYTPSSNYDVVTKGYVDNAVGNIITQAYSYGTSAPSDTRLLWIDTSTGNGILKYHNGSAWTAISAIWS